MLRSSDDEPSRPWFKARRLVSLSLILALAAIAMPCAGGQAAARVLRPDLDNEQPDAPQEGFLPRLSDATGRLCVKQCPADTLPCDPPSYKIADGRCTTQWH